MKKFDKTFCKEYVLRRKIELKSKIEKLDKKPTLCIIQVGDNFASNELPTT